MIRCSEEERVRILILDRPERRNALTQDMLAELRDLAAAPNSARALVLTGAGSMFCSGFDLAACAADPEGATMRRLLAGLSAVVRGLRAQPLPVVIAAQGGAIAGGCALLGGADVVISDQAARFGYPVVRLGVSPAVSAPSLVRSVGYGAARRLQLDPGLVDGAEALRLGLVHTLVARPEDVLPAAVELARGLAAKPPESLAATRGWLSEVEFRLEGNVRSWPDAALATSLSLVGGQEERHRLAISRQKPAPPR